MENAESQDLFWIKNAFRVYIPIQFSYICVICSLILWNLYNVPLVLPVIIMLLAKVFCFWYTFKIFKQYDSEIHLLTSISFEILFYFLLIPASFSMFHLIYAGIPLYISNVVFLFFYYKNTSNFALVKYFVLIIIEWGRSLCLIFFSLRDQGLIEWGWVFVFWPFWITNIISWICGICLFLGNLVNTQSENNKKIGVIWMIYTLISYPFIASLLIIGISDLKSGCSGLFFSLLLSAAIILLFNLFLTITLHTFIENFICSSFNSSPEDQPKLSIKKALKSFKSNFFLSKISSTLYSTDPNSHNKNPSDSVKQCLICYSEQCDCVLMPCGHAGLCLKCGNKLLESTKTCHICRVPIDQIYQISKESRVVLITEIENE